VSYLEEYGNTREEDLADYLLQNFNCSPGKAKKMLHHLIAKGQIFRLVHDRLSIPRVYITLETRIRLEELEDKVEARTSAESKTEAEKILEEAAVIAEKRIQDKSGKSF